jgi:hypothetical protein
VPGQETGKEVEIGCGAERGKDGRRAIERIIKEKSRDKGIG